MKNHDFREMYFHKLKSIQSGLWTIDEIAAKVKSIVDAEMARDRQAMLNSIASTQDMISRIPGIPGVPPAWDGQQLEPHPTPEEWDACVPVTRTPLSVDRRHSIHTYIDQVNDNRIAEDPFEE